jgi:hypothetical protein
VRRYPILLALIAITPTYLAAQQGQDLTEGTRVRIDGRFVGTIFDLSSDTLVVHGVDDRTSDSRSVAVAEIDRLEVSRGMKSNWKTGMWVGTLAGAAIGALAGAAGCEDSFIFSRDECIVMTGATGMLIGIPLGALTGALIKTERWENVPMEIVRVSVLPQGGGVTVGMSIGF